MNRKFQLQQSLEKNLDVIGRFGGKFELCLVNFIKDEEGEVIDQWIQNFANRENFAYYTSRALPYWHASIAKNTAHRVASGFFVINLDCDNLLDETELEQLLAYNDGDLSEVIFSAYSGGFRRETRFRLNKYRRLSYKPLRESPESGRDGTYGRIGLPKADFILLGGYDESLPPMGGQDKNLFKRAVAMFPHYHLLNIPGKVPPLQNDKADGLINTQKPDASWEELNQWTTEYTKQALKRRRIIANTDKHSLGVECQQVFSNEGADNISPSSTAALDTPGKEAL